MFLRKNGLHFFASSTSETAIAVELSIEPIGEWSNPSPQGDGLVQHRDASRHWQYIADTPTVGRWGLGPLALVAGDFCELVPHYYRSFKGLVGDGDYCLHCGAYNGFSGESRNGFDCYSCGSN